MKFHCIAMLATAALASSSGFAAAQIAVSANDGKQLHAEDVATGPTPDSISILDLGHGATKVIGSLNMPASMIGSPTAIAVARDSSYAIITAAQKFDPANPTKPLPDDKVTVVGLKDPAHPVVLQSLTAGPGASGVYINKAGTLALVASTEDDTITVFSIAGNKLTPAGKVQLDPKSKPTDVVFTNDGKRAFAVAQTISKLVELSIEGTEVKKTGRVIEPGLTLYGTVVTPDGRYLLVTDLGGTPDMPSPTPGTPRSGAVSVVDLRTNAVVSSIAVGPTPEHVTLSPDGRYVQVTVANGAANSKTAPNYSTVFGLVKVYRLEAGKMVLVASATAGHWLQGATWSDDGRTILQQAALEREIEVFHFDGASLTRDNAATLTFESRPGAVATAKSR